MTQKTARSSPASLTTVATAAMYATEIASAARASIVAPGDRLQARLAAATAM